MVGNWHGIQIFGAENEVWYLDGTWMVSSHEAVSCHSFTGSPIYVSWP